MEMKKKENQAAVLQFWEYEDLKMCKSTREV